MKLRTISLALILGILPVRGVDNPFIDAGLAASDREWRANDYSAALRAIADGRVPLPVLSNGQGAALFKRIANPVNFSFNRDTTLSLDKRLKDIFSVQGSASSLLKLYMTRANKGENLHAEVAMLLAFLLQSGAVGLELAEELLPTIAKDEKYEIRMDGLKKIKSGMMTMFSGAETSLSEKSFYSKDDLSVILQAMAQTISSSMKAFSPEFKTEMHKKISARKSEFASQEDAKQIDLILSYLNK